VERIVEYSDLQLEGSHDRSEIRYIAGGEERKREEREKELRETLYSIPSNWPDQGGIHFQDLKVRYREGLDLVLSGITASIKPHEKIGIVGRTGNLFFSFFCFIFFFLLLCVFLTSKNRSRKVQCIFGVVSAGRSIQRRNLHRQYQYRKDCMLHFFIFLFRVSNFHIYFI
jgi:hypothetical protein